MVWIVFDHYIFSQGFGVLNVDKQSRQHSHQDEDGHLMWQ